MSVFLFLLFPFQSESCGYVYILETPLICPQLAIEIANNGKNAVVNDSTAKTYTGKFWGKWKFIHNLFSILNELSLSSFELMFRLIFFLFCFLFFRPFFSFSCRRTRKKVSFRNVIVNQCESPKGSRIHNWTKKKRNRRCGEKLIKKKPKEKRSRKKSGDMTTTTKPTNFTNEHKKRTKETIKCYK